MLRTCKENELRFPTRVHKQIYAVPILIAMLWTTCVCLCVVAQFPVHSTASSPESSGGTIARKEGGSREPVPLADRSHEYPECSIDDLVCIEKHKETDRLGKEAIMQLHRQMDDDHDGDVELSESDEFLRDELKYVDDFERHTQLHRNDKEISVDELWKSWKYSEVYNWTVDRTVRWLEETVELPQYTERFQNNGIEGSALPMLASNTAQFMTAILGITDPIHRQKICLKAMDVVLFGPPKPVHNYLKDWLLVISLVVALGGCWFAFIQHRFSQSHVKQLLREMESLSRAEDSLKELQGKLDLAQEERKSAIREKQTIEKKLTDEITKAKTEAQRLHDERNDNVDGSADLATRLQLAEEELFQVRAALEEAERTLTEQQDWTAPGTLQQWLQLTHEIEYRYYLNKRVQAAKQLQEAKEECEKLRRKRASLIGSFRIAHGTSLDAVDQRIVTARSALAEVTADLKERTHRWNQIENLCHFAIMNNPGFTFLMGQIGITNGTDPAHGVQISEIGGEAPSQPVGIPNSGSVIGSLAHMAECNPPMGMDECDEDMPPAPRMYAAMNNPSMSSIPHNSSLQELRRSSNQRSQSQQSLLSLGSQVVHRGHHTQPQLARSASPTPNGGGTGHESKYILGGDVSFERTSSQDSSSSSGQQPGAVAVAGGASSSSLQSQGMTTASSHSSLTQAHPPPRPPPTTKRSSTVPLLSTAHKNDPASSSAHSSTLPNQLHVSHSDPSLTALAAKFTSLASTAATSAAIRPSDAGKKKRDQFKKSAMTPTVEEETSSSNEGDGGETTKKKHRLRILRLGNKDKVKTS